MSRIGLALLGARSTSCRRVSGNNSVSAPSMENRMRPRISWLDSGLLILALVSTSPTLAAPPGGHLNVENVFVAIGSPDTTLEINGQGFDDQVLANGSFEEAGRVPTHWDGMGLSRRDKRVCNMAQDGRCSFQMIGADVDKYLEQGVDIAGMAGDLVNLTGWSKADRPLARVGEYSLEAIVFYNDGSQKSYRARFGKRNHPWEYQVKAFLAKKDYNRVVVRVHFSKQRGKAWFDDVRLTRAEFFMVTPYVNEADILIYNAFTSEEGAADSPLGFPHGGIDFQVTQDRVPFRAVFAGEVETVDLFQNEIQGFWQVNVEIRFDPTYSVWYAFEPFTSDEADGQAQLDNILVSEGQSVSQGETIGLLHVGEGEAPHVHWSLVRGFDFVCPEPYFHPRAAKSIRKLLKKSWGKNALMCY